MDEEKPATGETAPKVRDLQALKEESWRKTKGKNFYFELFLLLPNCKSACS